MARRRSRQRFPEGEHQAEIHALSHDGRGVARIGEKTTFIHGALPNETVLFRYTASQRHHDEGQVTQVLNASSERVEPACPHYAICGGCALQHMESHAQILAKQTILMDNLTRIGQVEPQQILPPLTNPTPWGYRRKARLGVKYVAPKGKVLVGFRERGNHFIADLTTCPVLHPKVGEKLTTIAACIDQLSLRDKIPQIEVAMDDEQCVLVLRVLAPPTEHDQQQLLALAEACGYILYLQPAGPDSTYPLGAGIDLQYQLPNHHITLGFMPNDFTQVNTEINRQMVDRALTLLDLNTQDKVLDLFCGIGNFTLPLAQYASYVAGVEGDSGLIERAHENAKRNQRDNIDFYTANLYESLEPANWLRQSFNKALIDPPRSGAQQILHLLPQLGVERLVYISCYPGTLARDAGELVHQQGYRLVSAGVMDMFPHTAHVESIALFERVGKTLS